MMILDSRTKRRGHSYLSGNFAPVQQFLPLRPYYAVGTIPEELAGGEYVRNGGNPLTNNALERDAHWFDGDGMLSGVSFRRTDIILRTPILPSIATLVNPMSSLITIILHILRTITLVVLSHLPGSLQAIRKISIANTSTLYHNGRALAIYESGPPMRIALSSLDTIWWFNGKVSEGEAVREMGSGFGGKGPFNFFREWTTALPRADHKTKELILYHSTFVPPYVNYSVVGSTYDRSSKSDIPPSSLINLPLPDISSAKMMHDFGVSGTHTIIMDLPLSLDPLQLAKNKPVVAYDPTSRSRFGVFPRHRPQDVCWFKTNPCCIFHTANTWNSTDPCPANGFPGLEMVNMLACRLTSASLVFSAGDLAAPTPTHNIPDDQQAEEQYRLYYYQFCLPQSLGRSNSHLGNRTLITHQWSLSAIPFESPSLRDSASMLATKYIYGCFVSDTSFGAALGRAVKINSLVKVDVETLIERGIRDPPTQIVGCVDTRDTSEVMASQGTQEPIKVFKMPEGWYAQESRFVPRAEGASEDDSWILSCVFDESQLLENYECGSDAKSELWIVDAKNMTDVVARVHLPQRVPYGLHGN